MPAMLSCMTVAIVFALINRAVVRKKTSVLSMPWLATGVPHLTPLSLHTCSSQASTVVLEMQRVYPCPFQAVLFPWWLGGRLLIFVFRFQALSPGETMWATSFDRSSSKLFCWNAWLVVPDLLTFLKRLFWVFDENRSLVSSYSSFQNGSSGENRGEKFSGEVGIICHQSCLVALVFCKLLYIKLTVSLCSFLFLLTFERLMPWSWNLAHFLSVVFSPIAW